MLAREHARASFAIIADGASKEDVATGLSVLGGIEEEEGSGGETHGGERRGGGGLKEEDLTVLEECFLCPVSSRSNKLYLGAESDYRSDTLLGKLTIFMQITFYDECGKFNFASL